MHRNAAPERHPVRTRTALVQASRATAALVILAATAAGIVACGGDEDPELLFDSPATRVTPTVEADPVPPGGDADDAAIWVHPTDPANSTIIGTDKLGGLIVYDLAGREIQSLPDGDLNNVDLRPDSPSAASSSHSSPPPTAPPTGSRSTASMRRRASSSTSPPPSGSPPTAPACT